MLYDSPNLYQLAEYYIFPMTPARADASLTATLTFSTGTVTLGARDQKSLANAVQHILSVKKFVVDTASGKLHLAQNLTSVTFVVNKSETAHQVNPGLIGG